MEVSPANLFLADANYTPGSTRTPVRTLSQDDFLKLVMAQMTHQDPLNPQKDTEFIAQMTQFTALEQARATQADISRLQVQQQFLQANALLGRTVSVQDELGAVVRGTVSAIEVHAGLPLLVVDGRLFDLAALLAIEPAAATPAAQATNDPAVPGVPSSGQPSIQNLLPPPTHIPPQRQLVL